MKVITLVIAYAGTYHVVDTYCFPRTGESFIKLDYFKNIFIHKYFYYKPDLQIES